MAVSLATYGRKPVMKSGAKERAGSEPYLASTAKVWKICSEITLARPTRVETHLCLTSHWDETLWCLSIVGLTKSCTVYLEAQTKRLTKKKI